MKVLAIAFFSCICCNTAFSGEFIGDLILLPEGCQKSVARICKLEAELTYKSSIDNLVWQTDAWKDGNGKSGTTDGASIPDWAQSIIGDPYDKSYLKAAILHDHYCYEENHVRTWRQTHRMFYDALIDLGVAPVKAKTMYFAVYLFGPHWVELVPGENCGKNCIKTFSLNKKNIYLEQDQYTSEQSQNELEKFKKTIEDNPDMSVNEIEALAKSIKPDYFFFNQGNTYVPDGAKDSNVSPKK